MGAVWALLDSGSSAHVADAARDVPGADGKAHPKDAKGFQAADGKSIPHKGSVVTPMRVTEGDLGNATWKNAGVAMPTLGTKPMAHHEKELRGHEQDGVIADLKDGRVVAKSSLQTAFAC